MKKRLLSLALALAMCLGLLTVTASAAEGNSWPIRQVEMGRVGPFVVTEDNSLYTWGGYSDNASEYRGIKGNVYSSLWPNGIYKTPTKVMSDVQAVAASNYPCVGGGGAMSRHLENVLMILKTDGSLWVWGENNYGQLGQGTQELATSRTDFSIVKVMDNVKTMDCSGNLCAAITNNGDLYYWGVVYGAIGGTTSSQYKVADIVLTPTKILSNAVAVSIGEKHILALTADGSVYAMGDQSGGKLGNGADKGEPTTAMTKVMDGCTAIATGRSFSMALGKNGTVYAWGVNSSCVFGVLYDDLYQYTTPTAIMTGVKQIFAASDNAAYIKNDGSLWITGDNRFGIHGQGKVFYAPWTNEKGYPFPCKYVPVQVDTNVKSVGLHNKIMLYVKNDGIMYGTGASNSFDGFLYTFSTDGEVLQVSTDKTDGTAAVCSPTLAGTSLTPYTGSWPAKPTVGGFTDVKKGDFFASPVLWAVENGITDGVSKTKFAPARDCTHAEIITFLWRASGKPPADDSPLKVSKSYQKAVNWAYAQGMIDDSFQQDTLCTRADAVTYIWKARGATKADETKSFKDVPADADYADAVSWAVANGVTEGTSKTKFSPGKVCSRGEIVTFLYRAFK